MKQILFFIFSACLTFMACSSHKIAKSPAIEQGITGRVVEETGNRMPMVGAQLPEPKGVKVKVLIYEPTNISQVTRTGTAPLYTAIHTKLIDSVQTDSTGHFTIALAPGSYSLFIKQGREYYGNLFDTQNNIALFTVAEGQLTRVKLTINTGAVY